MALLIITTILWAFSFSLYGEYLAGHVDSYFAVLTRIVIAGSLFVPLTRWRGHAPAFVRGMLLIGALRGRWVAAIAAAVAVAAAASCSCNWATSLMPPVR